MGGTGYAAYFEYVRTYRLVPEPPHPGEPAIGEATFLTLSGAPATVLAWTPAANASAYDVLRGSAAGLASWDYGACLGDGLAATTLIDGDTPAPGIAFTYLVRGEDSGCDSAGPWSFDLAGSETVNLDASTCP
jgi:hypothetical protein